MPVTLKSAGTRSATWLAGPAIGAAGNFLLDQAAFAALPDDNALKALFTADYTSTTQIGEALARSGFSLSVNSFPTVAGQSGVAWAYQLAGTKAEIYLSTAAAAVDWVSVKLSVAYSASR